MSRPFTAPPGVPAEALAALHVGFKAAANDIAMVDEAAQPRLRKVAREYLASVRSAKCAKFGQMLKSISGNERASAVTSPL